MGQAAKESYAEFIDSLKAAGVEISNESELTERLAESQRWHYSFMTLARNGAALGIRFLDRGASRHSASIRKAFQRFEFPGNSDSVFADSLASD
ncbi:hypothetical protein VVD49_20910 [Uliginosibacterium sp. H3]|uniref:Uncharacterized protein n=1 Tax=Uliginosibacterium silvisoli TaxID=3114758 RepID=A0ABU6K8R8_9RHOO|nr:hypothetical protein [Uliginosibacterium sp. H3]